MYFSFADDYDTNLCSGRPVNGLTTLKNGTIVAFRGQYQMHACFKATLDYFGSKNFLFHFQLLTVRTVYKGKKTNTFH